MFLSENTPLVAIDIGSHSIKMAQMEGSGDNFELLNFSVMPLKEESIVDGVIREPDEVVEALTKLIKLEKVETRYAVASIAGEAVIIKKIRVPRMTAEELKENIASEAEQYIPFDIDDVSIDFQLLDGTGSEESEDKDTMEILLVAVQKDLVDSLTEILYDAGLKPAIIDLDVFAMVNACGLGVDLKAEGVVAVIDLGESFTHLNIIQEGVTAYTRDIPLGGNFCTKKLMSKFNLSHKEAVKLKLGKISAELKGDEVVEVIVQSFEKVIDEVQKAFEFFSTTFDSPVNRAYITGGGALIQGMEGLFSDRLNTSVEILNPMKGIKVNKRKFDQNMIDTMGPLSAVALGLAARKFDYQ
jgi:type IV pilus assembly protein PilM